MSIRSSVVIHDDNEDRREYHNYISYNQDKYYNRDRRDRNNIIVRGPTGKTGPQGPQGQTGPQGPEGYTGHEGPQGPSGQTGSDGLQGPTGYTGTNGIQGPTGYTGTNGIQGPTGSNGQEGPIGLQGTTGPQGPTGLNGSLTGNILLTQGPNININTTNTDNYNLMNGYTFYVMESLGSVSSNISGFMGGTSGRMIILINSTDVNQTFLQESTNSLISNRLVIGSPNVVINRNQSIMFLYVNNLVIGSTSGQNRWVMISNT